MLIVLILLVFLIVAIIAFLIAYYLKYNSKKAKKRCSLNTQEVITNLVNKERRYNYENKK